MTSYGGIKNRVVMRVIHFDQKMKFIHLSKSSFIFKQFVNIIETLTTI